MYASHASERGDITAYRCGEYRDAEQLIGYGLVANPNDLLREELYELLSKVRHHEWLKARDLSMWDDELAMSMKGVEADEGVLEYSALLKRIGNLGVLLRNTIGLVSGTRFESLSLLGRESPNSRDNAS